MAPRERGWICRFTAHARVLGLAAAALVQLVLLLWATHTAVPQSLSCDVCDTSYYYTAAAEIAKAGLLFDNPHDGYRSYFVPLFIAAVQKVAASTGYDGSAVEQYAYGVSILFWLVSVGLMGWLARRVRMSALLWLAGATVLNPFLVVYVPFALQEGVLMVWCLPLLFVWAAAKDLAPSTRAALVLVIALVAYIVRSSLVWWLLPATAYAGWLLRPHLRNPRRWLPSFAIVLVTGCLLIGPQIYIAKEKADSFNPYPNTALFSTQVAFGISLLKYATVEDEGHWRGLTFYSPFVTEPEEDKTLQFYLDHPARAAFLMLGHAYAGFHYDQIMPYWPLASAHALTIWLVLTSAVVFLGVIRMTNVVVSGALDPDGAFAIATFALCAASVMFVAPESRFGVIGFAMLSIHVAEWLVTRPTRAQWTLLVPGLLMYLVLSFLYNTLLIQSADIRL